MPDVGVLASTDIVAVEQASIDKICVEDYIEGSLPHPLEVRDVEGHLLYRIHGKDPYPVSYTHLMLHEGGTQWKDMVVLVPSRNYYDPLEEAFEKQNIPAVFVEQKSFFSRSETLDATALLSALSDPEDDFALIGLLSSPFLRLSQEAALKAISSIEGDNGRGRAWKYVKANLPTVARKIEDLRHRAFLRGPSNALNYLLEDPL